MIAKQHSEFVNRLVGKTNPTAASASPNSNRQFTAKPVLAPDDRMPIVIVDSRSPAQAERELTRALGNGQYHVRTLASAAHKTASHEVKVDARFNSNFEDIAHVLVRGDAPTAAPPMASRKLHWGGVEVQGPDPKRKANVQPTTGTAPSVVAPSTIENGVCNQCAAMEIQVNALMKRLRNAHSTSLHCPVCPGLRTELANTKSVLSDLRETHKNLLATNLSLVDRVSRLQRTVSALKVEGAKVKQTDANHELRQAHAQIDFLYKWINQMANSNAIAPISSQQQQPASIAPSSPTGTVAAAPAAQSSPSALESTEPTTSLSRVTGSGAPEGDVTFVFTDVQGSTALWEEFTAVMPIALRVHNEAVRAAITATGGYEVKTEGDSFMVAFSHPLRAVQFASQVQMSLLQQTWPEALTSHAVASSDYDTSGTLIFRGLRVRMAIHVGKPICDRDRTTFRMDYYGPVVNTCARLMSSVDGGYCCFSTAVLARLHSDSSSPDYLKVLHSVGFHGVDLGNLAFAGVSEKVRCFKAVPSTLVGRLSGKNDVLESNPEHVHGHAENLAGGVRPANWSLRKKVLDNSLSFLRETREAVTAQLTPTAERSKALLVGTDASLLLAFSIAGISHLWSSKPQVAAKAMRLVYNIIVGRCEQFGVSLVYSNSSVLVFVCNDLTSCVNFALTVDVEILSVQWPLDVLSVSGFNAINVHQSIPGTGDLGLTLWNGPRLKAVLLEVESKEWRQTGIIPPEHAVVKVIGEVMHNLHAGQFVLAGDLFYELSSRESSLMKPCKMSVYRTISLPDGLPNFHGSTAFYSVTPLELAARESYFQGALPLKPEFSLQAVWARDEASLLQKMADIDLVVQHLSTALGPDSSSMNSIVPPSHNVVVLCVRIAFAETLWTSNYGVMAKASEIYWKYLRTLASEWRGYETFIDSDSCYFIFQSEVDAICCAVDLQAGLLELNWDPKLIDLHECCAERSYGDQVVNRGLSVKVGLGSGHASVATVALGTGTYSSEQKASGCVSSPILYFGKPVQMANVLADDCYPGDILIDKDLFTRLSGLKTSDFIRREFVVCKVGRLNSEYEVFSVTPKALKGRKASRLLESLERDNFNVLYFINEEEGAEAQLRVNQSRRSLPDAKAADKPYLAGVLKDGPEAMEFDAAEAEWLDTSKITAMLNGLTMTDDGNPMDDLVQQWSNISVALQKATSAPSVSHSPTTSAASGMPVARGSKGSPVEPSPSTFGGADEPETRKAVQFLFTQLPTLAKKSFADSELLLSPLTDLSQQFTTAAAESRKKAAMVDSVNNYEGENENVYISRLESIASFYETVSGVMEAVSLHLSRHLQASEAFQHFVTGLGTSLTASKVSQLVTTRSAGQIEVSDSQSLDNIASRSPPSSAAPTPPRVVTPPFDRKRGVLGGEGLDLKNSVLSATLRRGWVSQEGVSKIEILREIVCSFENSCMHMHDSDANGEEGRPALQLKITKQAKRTWKSIDAEELDFLKEVNTDINLAVLRITGDDAKLKEERRKIHLMRRDNEARDKNFKKIQEKELQYKTLQQNFTKAIALVHNSIKSYYSLFKTYVQAKEGGNLPMSDEEFIFLWTRSIYQKQGTLWASDEQYLFPEPKVTKLDKSGRKEPTRQDLRQRFKDRIAAAIETDVEEDQNKDNWKRLLQSIVGLMARHFEMTKAYLRRIQVAQTQRGVRTVRSFRHAEQAPEEPVEEKKPGGWLKLRGLQRKGDLAKLAEPHKSDAEAPSGKESHLAPQSESAKAVSVSEEVWMQSQNLAGERLERLQGMLEVARGHTVNSAMAVSIGGVVPPPANAPSRFQLLFLESMS